ncbi:MAG TPA: SCO1664 family protein [Roseiflexaceae bacterium]|nr:SCO1664 family protein [Roseiflexaceae bacterium]
MSVAQVLSLLADGTIDVQGMLPWSSNYTLLVTVSEGGRQGLAVYKPRRGERPLWDFPRGTLCQREAAAYLLNATLGWSLVPPTVLRDGPYGIGSVQLYIDNDPEQHLFTMQKEGGYDDVLEQLATFDFLANNADRKSGHCLKGSDNRLWAIDHGICFHHDYKLRTVLWDYAGKPLRPDILDDLRLFRDRLSAGDATLQLFEQLLSKGEMRALRRRLDQLIDTGKHLEPGPGRNVPWPPV